MNFLIFLAYYIICTSIVLLISIFIFKKYVATYLISEVLHEAFDNNDLDSQFVNLTDTLNDMNNSQNNDDSPKFF